MANLCILPDQAAKFRQALKEKDINPASLLNMSTEERTKLFSGYVGDNAKVVNTLFEEKLVLKNRMQGIKNWASKVGNVGKYSVEGKAKLAQAMSEYRAAQQERIFSPQEHEAFLNDLADKQLGTHITKEQAAKVFELSKKVQDTNSTSDLSGVSAENLKARQELNDYVNSVNAPTTTQSIIKNLSIIGRNNLLLNLSTPIKATTGQVVNSVMEFIGRRLSSLSLSGSSDLAAQANKEAWSTFRKTGVNTASMESIDDTHVLGKGENFKLPAQTSSRSVGLAEKVIRNTARISNKVAIDWEHNFTFTKFYQKTFFDTSNIRATTLAKSEGLEGAELKARTNEIFKDAVRVKPETKEGAIVRHMAQEQSARITSTNDSLVSRFALGAKNALNKVIPGVPLGDFIMPIAKIPASIIANGIDNAGAGIPKGIIDIYQGRAKMQSPDLETRYEGSAQFATGIQRMMRIAGTLSVAALLASQFKKSDFRSDQYGNHFVKIGGIWINMEYINAISPALAGMMNAKMSGNKGFTNDVGQYTGGVLSSLKSAPGIDEANSLITSITNTDLTKGIQKYTNDFFTSRGEPMFIKNLQNNRPINRLFFGSTGVNSDQQYKADLKTKAAKAAATRKANDLKKKLNAVK